ncbi:flagellar hook capping FlgD N-terminal domain-containing protein [Rhodoplanes sp. TEM]|uniref:Basal-body rod modification protein FlgD n=1 Tax=Rhodoplanes tepidamans TaxID=200616 RepID=A0ABT5J5V8_RHOTP|nr:MULTISPECIES: flagellar hook capping FlgD N-terminal domain-containing protein [Rhodoplanes]MDC7784684.1 flagellar hook capping FlgD N-terminal domain-containing protein [Rhodoplanes tepidamans]MDC7982151.1 flagellar hook capping FlgD N-terminal domain-containing protein [Rhodoplanes sp. TEM]MDQ0356155.1 flagellar basal-body rod modification protein FlgD [Rhodoplanes tepidamans]
MATAGVTGTQFNATAAVNTAATMTSTDSTTLANNFQSFLLMLTTQLQNQNPLDPLDTNQFTQQLVQFSQVEQLLKSNQQLEALVSLQKTAQNTQALGFVGATVVVDGSSATLPNAGTATWGFNVAKPSSGTITITNPAGQTVYSSNYTLQAGVQQFTWDGKGKDGTQWPPGQYKMTVTAKDALGNPVAVSTEVQGVVDSVDVSSTPPLLMIGSEEFTVDKVKRIVRPTS